MKHLRRISITLFAVLLIGVLPLTVQGQQPTINGTIDTNEYEQLAEWTEGDTGFGDHGMLELWAERDDEYLYVFIVGEAESNGNHFFLFIDVDSQDGVSSGTQLPAGDDEASPFSEFQPTNDFETDYGIRLTALGDDAFVSIADYVSWDSGDANDTFLAGVSDDGAAETVDTDPYDGATIAYNDTGDLINHTGVEGWEMAIPLDAIGATPGDEFRFFALYGAADFISANTLPEIAGQGGNNLGEDPDFTQITGDQHTSPNPLPVELTSFTAALDGTTAQLRWETASETDNAGFEVQHSAGNSDFEALDFVEGYGTTDAPRHYSFTVDNLEPGTHQFRLKQIDFDGTSELKEAQTVEVSAEAPIVLHSVAPNPVRSQGTLEFAVQEARPVTISLYNTLGQRIQTLYDGTPSAHQTQTVDIDVGNLPSGTYFIRTEGIGSPQTRSMTVVR